jgi:hypothetical protein
MTISFGVRKNFAFGGWINPDEWEGQRKSLASRGLR